MDASSPSNAREVVIDPADIELPPTVPIDITSFLGPPSVGR